MTHTRLPGMGSVDRVAHTIEQYRPCSHAARNRADDIARGIVAWDGYMTERIAAALRVYADEWLEAAARAIISEGGGSARAANICRALKSQAKP